MTLSFKNIILLFPFFIVLATSLWDNNIYLLFTFSVLCWIFLPQKKWWDKTAISLLFFSFFYALILLLKGQVTSYFNLMSYFISPVAFYRFGRFTMTIFRDGVSRQKFLLVSLFLYLLYFFIQTFKDVSVTGIVNVNRTLLSDISDESSLAATIYGMMASTGIGCISVMFIKKGKLWIRLCYIILSLLSLFSVIHLVNRTGVIVFLACIILTIFVVTKMNILKILGITSVVIVLIFAIMQIGIIDQSIIDAYLQREESSTTNFSQMGGRLGMWLSAIGSVFVKPFGWIPVGYRYVHNLWLDIARVAGLLAFIPFVSATILHIKTLLHLLRQNQKPNFIIILISINAAMLMSSFVEPVIEASLLFFCLLMTIWGITKSLVRDKSICL